jgi:hypothetical protein
VLKDENSRTAKEERKLEKMKNRKTIFTATVLVLAFALAPIIPTGAQNPSSEVQFQDSSLVGTWRSGVSNFAYTFSRDGRYVLVGAIETTNMSTTTAEEGTYAVNGDQLILRRQNGKIEASNGYTQDLKPQTTVFGWRRSGQALQLIFPNGMGAETFYLSE